MTLRRMTAVVAVLVALLPGRAAKADTFALSLFEQYVESLRQQAKIPGLSAVIVEDQDIVWERGFGFQDLEASVRAMPDTPYPINDLSQIFASALLLQCVDQGRLRLDQPMGEYTKAIPELGTTVRHVLSHASEGTPGTAFKYDPSRYAALTPVVESCRQLPYRKAVAQQILERLAMRDSVPGEDIVTFAESQPLAIFSPLVVDRYAHVLDRLAKPYRVDRNGRASRSDHQSGMNAALGLVSTVRDLARLDVALDRDASSGADVLLSAGVLQEAWTNTTSTRDTSLPTGLGWFVQTYQGQRVIWHFGFTPDVSSSLIVKLPAKKLTLILLANSDGLSSPFKLSAGDVSVSFFARAFLRIFG